MGLKDQAVTWRRYFHQFPELSDKEFKTTQKIKDILTEHHIRILDLPLATGLVAEVGQGLSCIAVRADIDALPIQELVEQDFKSENEGVMHACGHDIHMASILATAVKLKEIEGTLTGRVKFIFQ
ncbi:TPA: amidohydrolase, partial [Staphylococcus aureus]|nr:amidohydrolase [Staphylococcus aureus]HDA8386617.1 amidohydrolase [Staphylococcus aureus]HDG7337478.1 amidohydrolase [Staphylococcus aureus]HEK6662541.1 amidohydrolase [Staphylococcus aureus]